VAGSPSVYDIHVYHNTFYADMELYDNTVITDLHNNIIKRLVIHASSGNYIENHSHNIFGNDPEGIGDTDNPFVVDSTELAGYDLDSLFVDAAARDFNLKEGSAAIDFGDPAFGVDVDIRNYSRDASPDAGCYEYGATDPPDPDPDPDPQPEPQPDPEPGPDTVPLHAVPEKTSLACYNNVFNPKKGGQAIIQVNLHERSHVQVVLYDNKGKKIKTIVDEERDAGFYPISWNGNNDAGNAVGSGIYIVHMKSGKYTNTKKIIVIK